MKPDPLTESGAIWLVGCGNMGSAMLRGWLATGISPAQITVIDPALQSAPEGVTLRSAPAAESAPPGIVLLGIKPQALDTVAPLLAPYLGGETVLLSILAGVEIVALRQRFPKPEHIVRVMPNMPASIGKGVTALYSGSNDAKVRATAEQLMRPLGIVEWVDDEALFHAATALSGCGPAFVLRFIDALTAAGHALGLNEDQAYRLAIATISGSTALAAEAAETPAQIANRVASPGGATREGLNVLDANNALFDLIAATLKASAARSLEMADTARS